MYRQAWPGAKKWRCRWRGHKFYPGVSVAAISGPTNHAMVRECKRCGELVGWI
jgi:hypothetical protein